MSKSTVHRSLALVAMQISAELRPTVLNDLTDAFGACDTDEPESFATSLLQSCLDQSNIHGVADRGDCAVANTWYNTIDNTSQRELVASFNQAMLNVARRAPRILEPDGGRMWLLLDGKQVNHSHKGQRPAKAPPKSRRAHLEKASKSNARYIWITHYVLFCLAWFHKGRLVTLPVALYPMNRLQNSTKHHAKLAGEVSRALGFTARFVDRPATAAIDSAIGDRHYESPLFINALADEELDPLVRLKTPKGCRLKFYNEHRPNGDRLQALVDDAVASEDGPFIGELLQRDGTLREYEYFRYNEVVRLSPDGRPYRVAIRVSVHRRGGKYVPYPEDSFYLLGPARSISDLMPSTYMIRWAEEILLYFAEMVAGDHRPRNRNYEFLALWMRLYVSGVGALAKAMILANSRMRDVPHVESYSRVRLARHLLGEAAWAAPLD